MISFFGKLCEAFLNCTFARKRPLKNTFRNNATFGKRIELDLSTLIRKNNLCFLSIAVASIWGATANAQSSEADLGQQLSNPVSSLISVPFQFNFDRNLNVDDQGEVLTLNVQPVIPFSISDDWNLISRTIVPLKWSDNFPVAGTPSDFGFGDIVQSFFFSPKKPTANGWIWGAGPVLVLPLSRINDNPFYGAGEWAGGVTAVALRQQNGWTYGALVNHVVDFGGKTDINATFLQPFVSYTTPNAWTFSLNTESTYDWENAQWTVPINGSVSKVVRIGSQAVSFQLGARYHADGPASAPKGWGVRFGATLLFPK
ncbi:transporter [Shimia sp. SDUM112013]|uniref:transporter n=1 Tax=Shimia sp. SDUM112013 TaxID=3136160 RepID=UPI0032EC67FD